MAVAERLTVKGLRPSYLSAHNMNFVLTPWQLLPCKIVTQRPFSVRRGSDARHQVLAGAQPGNPAADRVVSNNSAEPFPQGFTVHLDHF